MSTIQAMTITQDAPVHRSLLFAQYEERLRRLKRDRQTIRNFEHAAGKFLAWCDEQGLDPAEIEGWQIEEYLAGLDLAPSTKALHLTQIRAVYRYGLRRGTISRDPTIDVELPREPDRAPTIIEVSELRAIRARCRTRHEWLMFHFLAYTGMRKSEILGLLWDDINLPRETITVLGKGGKLRLVPIHPALGEVLAAENEKMGRVIDISGSGWHYTLKRLTDHTAHDFRRTVASSLARNGVAERIIDKILGWAPRTVRDRYYVNVADWELKTGILKLYADDPL